MKNLIAAALICVAVTGCSLDDRLEVLRFVSNMADGYQAPVTTSCSGHGSHFSCTTY